MRKSDGYIGAALCLKLLCSHACVNVNVEGLKGRRGEEGEGERRRKEKEEEERS